MSELLTELDDTGVLTIKFNRPESNNGWTYTMEAEYFAALDDANTNEAVRAIVLTGVGRAFCPGLDVKVLAAASAAGKVQTAGRRPQTYPRNILKPLIGAINGACAGIGFVQAMMCDVRFVAREARLTTAFARRGLVAEYGMSYVLPRLIGHERALDLLLSGRTFDGAEAYELGLASRVLPAEEVLPAAQAYARDIALNASPIAIAVAKAQVARDYLDGLVDARRWAEMMRDRYAPHPDFEEGVTSFREKRAPKFAPLPPNFKAPTV
ncbi:MAG: enoyl-CoA hydratase-related protein [Acidimicrobiia bacterium]